MHGRVVKEYRFEVNPCFRNTHFMEKASDIKVYRGLFQYGFYHKSYMLIPYAGLQYLSLGQDEQRGL